VARALIVGAFSRAAGESANFQRLRPDLPVDKVSHPENFATRARSALANHDKDTAT
jgi:hypothetical protein